MVSGARILRPGGCRGIGTVRQLLASYGFMVASTWPVRHPRGLIVDRYITNICIRAAGMILCLLLLFV